MISLTTDEFVDRARIVHGNLYDYSKTIYLNNKTKIIIICKVHGEFLQLPNNHVDLKRGCARCAIQKKTFNTAQFVARANKLHNNLYDYSESIYINNYTKLKIKCNIHGIFEQIPADHYKHGCNRCAIEYRAKQISRSQNEFISQAQKVHGNKYNYSLSIYKNNITKIKIICPKHGVFFQKPVYHLSGCHCPICAKAGYSNAEKKWLDSLNIPEEYRQYKIKIGNKKLRVDGYDPISNTVFEYNGDYFHGNPLVYNNNEINQLVNKSFGELYKETITRENMIRSSNYNLVIKWETER